jgi:hypothetical protein
MDPKGIGKGKESCKLGQQTKETTMKIKSIEWKKSIIATLNFLNILSMLLGMANLAEISTCHQTTCQTIQKHTKSTHHL